MKYQQYQTLVVNVVDGNGTVSVNLLDHAELERAMFFSGDIDGTHCVTAKVTIEIDQEVIVSEVAGQLLWAAEQGVKIEDRGLPLNVQITPKSNFSAKFSNPAMGTGTIYLTLKYKKQ